MDWGGDCRLEEREQQLRETVEDACRVNELLERLFQCMQSADRESAALARGAYPHRETTCAFVHLHIRPPVRALEVVVWRSCIHPLPLTCIPSRARGDLGRTEEQEFVELRDHHQDAIRELRQGLSQAQALLSQGDEGVQRPDFLSEQGVCGLLYSLSTMDVWRDVRGVLFHAAHRR